MNSTRRLRGNEVIAKALAQLGATTVFSMLGGTNVPWIADGIARGGLRLVKTRHEETAVTAAALFGRATRTVGLCSVTRGPGFANAVNALTGAVRSHLPLVLLVGESPPSRAATDQIFPQAEVARAVGAGFLTASTAVDVPGVLAAAFRTAWSSAVPQVVSIADGVLEEVLPEEDVVTVSRGEGGARRSAKDVGAGEALAMQRAADLLMAADEPLILAGQGAVLAGVRESLEVLADLTGAWLATTLRANRFFSGHHRDLGLCGGWAAPVARPILDRADVVLAVGASLNGHTTDQGRLLSDAQLIACDINDSAPAVQRADLKLVGDAGQIVAGIRENCQPSVDRGGHADGAVAPTWWQMKRSLLERDLGGDRQGLDPRAVYARLDDLLPNDRVVVTDGGQALGTLPSLINARDAYSWHVGRSYGSIGLGLPSAVGVAVAWPDRPVVLFCGDGGFAMALHALDDVRVNGLDLTVVIMNDEQYGSEVKHLAHFGFVPDLVRQSLPEVTSLAASFGGQGYLIEELHHLDRVPFTDSGLRILDVRTSRSINPRQAYR